MTLDEISAWVAGGESEVLELKLSTRMRREAVRALCAMLNHRGGSVIFGVDPAGRVLGQSVSDHTLEEIATEVGKIDPPVFPHIKRIPVRRGLDAVMVSVDAGRSCPYSYGGRAFRRVGNTSPVMTRDEYNRALMDRLHGERRWDNEPAENWTVSDLDGSEVARCVEEAIRRGRIEEPGSRDPEALLLGLGLLRDGLVMRAAVALFGRPERLTSDYPQCLLRMARFRGKDRSEFLDNTRRVGNIYQLLRVAGSYLVDSLPVSGRIVPGVIERVDEPLYPPVALREALVNAFCHRDYSSGGGSVGLGIYDDRLEITSVGTLHFGLTAQALYEPHESRPWNPLIAQTLFRSGTIEGWGRGTIKMIEQTREAGLAPPEIEDAGGCVTVRFRPSRYQPPKRVSRDVTERQQAILALLAGSRGGLALREILDGIGNGAKERQVRADLAVLKTLGLASSSGHGRGARWTARVETSAVFLRAYRPLPRRIH